MRAVGLITEYNPFHYGHLYHLRRSLELADAKVAVAVMSGHFLQGGGCWPLPLPICTCLRSVSVVTRF